MNARNLPKPGWVTVAAAAAALTDAGDTIDASNVSRYLARNLDIPQEKIGKFRFVDLVALKQHRSSSLFVADKRQAREIDLPSPVRTPVAADRDDDLDDEAPQPGGSAIQSTNLELKQLELRRKRREDDIEEGRVVPIEDLQSVVAAMMGAFVSELAREETLLTTKLGRETGILIRQAHRKARAAASARLIEAAKEQLHPAALDQMAAPSPPDVVAA